MKCKANYYEDGMITVILPVSNEEYPLDQSTIKQYVSYPQSKSLHIYGVNTKNYEQVHALVRCVKSLSQVEVFCYTQEPLCCIEQLIPMCTKVIVGVM